MRGGGVAWTCVALVGCGRIGFAPGSNGGDGSPPGETVAPSCPAFALLCDDFESGDLATWTRVDTGQGGTAVVTTARAHAGTHALEADGPPQATSGAQGAPTLRFAAMTSGVLAVREWIDLMVPMQRFDLVAEMQTLSPLQYITAGGDDNAVWASSELGPPGNVGPDHTSTTATPAVGTWACLEMVYTFASGASNATIQLFVDEMPVLDAPANDSNGATYNEVAIGIPRADKAGFHVFVDDVVIAPQRIHCN